MFAHLDGRHALRHLAAECGLLLGQPGGAGKGSAGRRGAAASHTGGGDRNGGGGDGGGHGAAGLLPIRNQKAEGGSDGRVQGGLAPWKVNVILRPMQRRPALISSARAAIGCTPCEESAVGLIGEPPPCLPLALPPAANLPPACRRQPPTAGWGLAWCRALTSFWPHAAHTSRVWFPAGMQQCAACTRSRPRTERLLMWCSGKVGSRLERLNSLRLLKPGSGSTERAFNARGTQGNADDTTQLLVRGLPLPCVPPSLPHRSCHCAACFNPPAGQCTPINIKLLYVGSDAQQSPWPPRLMRLAAARRRRGTPRRCFIRRLPHRPSRIPISTQKITQTSGHNHTAAGRPSPHLIAKLGAGAGDGAGRGAGSRGMAPAGHCCRGRPDRRSAAAPGGRWVRRPLVHLPLRVAPPQSHPHSWPAILPVRPCCAPSCLQASSSRAGSAPPAPLPPTSVPAPPPCWPAAAAWQPAHKTWRCWAPWRQRWLPAACSCRRCCWLSAAPTGCQAACCWR